MQGRDSGTQTNQAPNFPNPFTEMYNKVTSPQWRASIQSSPYVEGTIRTFAPAFLISLTNYPAQLVTARMQVGLPILGAFIGNPKFIEGYKNSLFGTLYKNVSLSHRESLNEIINRKPIISETEGDCNDPIDNIKLVLTVSALDTFSTQYFANRGKQLAQGLELPVFKTYGEMFTYGRQTVFTRYTRNVTGVGCFVVTERVKNAIEKMLPYEQYGYLGFALSHIITGTISGVTTMGFDGLWSQQLYRMDMRNFQVPSVASVFSELWKNGGVKAIMRGTTPNVLGMIATYFTISFFEIGMKKAFPKVPTDTVATTPLAPRFFHVAPKPEQIVPDPVVKTEEPAFKPKI